MPVRSSKPLKGVKQISSAPARNSKQSSRRFLRALKRRSNSPRKPRRSLTTPSGRQAKLRPGTGALRTG